jgi:hypothetical protein
MPTFRMPDPTQDPIYFTSIPEEQEAVRNDTLSNQANLPLGTAAQLFKCIDAVWKYIDQVTWPILLVCAVEIGDALVSGRALMQVHQCSCKEDPMHWYHHSKQRDSSPRCVSMQYNAMHEYLHSRIDTNQPMVRSHRPTRLFVSLLVHCMRHCMIRAPRRPMRFYLIGFGSACESSSMHMMRVACYQRIACLDLFDWSIVAQ